MSAPADSPVKLVTVKLVAVAAVTTPVPEGEKATELLTAVGEKPRPVIVSVAAVSIMDAVLAVTTGVTEATCVAAPLLPNGLLRVAFRGPAETGLALKVTVI